MVLHLLSLVLLQPFVFSNELSTNERQLMEKLLQESIAACPPTDISNPCYNDEDCKVYGDCCSETALRYLQNPNITLHPFLPAVKRWTCTRINTLREEHKWFPMVSSCPRQWQDIQVSLRCTKSGQFDNYSHILDIPVLSNNTNVMYSNVYCALCNNDSSAMAPTQLEFSCSPETAQCEFLLKTALYTPGQLQWQSAYVQIKAYLEVLPSKPCTESIDYCDAKNSSLETVEEKAYRKLCYMHSYPIRIADNGYNDVYKNVHCAVCNGELPKASSCKHDEGSYKSVQGFQFITFSLLIDFHGGGKVGDPFACGVGEMYDSVKGICVAYNCGKLLKMDKFGKCVPKNVFRHGNKIHADITPHIDSCTKILASQHEYTYVNSSTIRVNRKNHQNIFETQYFEETGNGSVLICAPDTVTLRTGNLSTVQIRLTLYIVMGTSLVCLAVHILVYISVAKLHNLPGNNLLSLSCSIFMAELVFISAVNLKEPYYACVAIGAALHLSYLSSFFWMNVMAFDTFRTFASKSLRQNDQHQQRRKFKLYSTYAWMCPCLIVAISLVLDATNAIPELKLQYGEPYCWINSRMALAIFVGLPMLVLLVENIVFFTLTASAIRRTTTDVAIATRASTASERTRFLLYLKLASIVGLTWIFGFIAAFTDLKPLWYLNIILKSIQGTFIFFAFTFKRATLSAVMKKLPKNYFTPQGRKAAEPVTTRRFQLTELPPNKYLV